MTIKELCNKYQHCTDCPLNTICCLNDALYYLMTTNEEFNKDVTKSIIETAKLLESDNKGSTLTNREWVDLLQRNFNVSRTVAKEMLHGLMAMKRYYRINQTFN